MVNRQIKTCRKKRHVRIDNMKEMPNLICSNVAVGGNFKSTRDSKLVMVDFDSLPKNKEKKPFGNEVKITDKKYVRYKEGAERYSMGLHTFQELAKEANAIYRVRKIVLVNTEIFEEFLETFKEDQWK